MKKDLDYYLDNISLIEADEMKEINVKGWFGVADETGVNSFFATEKMAAEYRLFLINKGLNG